MRDPADILDMAIQSGLRPWDDWADMASIVRLHDMIVARERKRAAELCWEFADVQYPVGDLSVAIMGSED